MLVTRRLKETGDLMMMPPMKLTFNTALLGVEAWTVIGIRLSQTAMGHGTPAEGQLMVTEKVLAFVEISTTMARGGSAQTAVSGYRKRVRANLRRFRR